MPADRPRQRGDQVFLGARVRLRRLGQVECAERLLELRADAIERGARAGRDHRADELQREPDRARLERRQPRRPPERVAEELLVDVHLVAAQLGVDGVAAAAEVDEVQQREVLLERLLRDWKRSTSCRPGSRPRAPRRTPTAGTRAATAGRRSARARRPGRPLGRPPRTCPAPAPPSPARRRRAGPRGARALDREPAQRRGRERHGAAVLAEDPAREQRQRGVLGDEDVALEAVRGRRTCARATTRCRARPRSAPRRSTLPNCQSARPR